MENRNEHPAAPSYSQSPAHVALGCRNQFRNCLGDVVRVGSVGSSEDADEGLQHLAGDRSNLAVGCARLGITGLCPAANRLVGYALGCTSTTSMPSCESS